MGGVGEVAAGLFEVGPSGEPERGDEGVADDRHGLGCGAVPVRRVEASSLKVVSRTQWILFSMAPQCPRRSSPSSGAVALSGARLVAQ